MEGNPANLRWFYILEDVLEAESSMRDKVEKCQESLKKYPLVIHDLQHCLLLRHFDQDIVAKMKTRVDMEKTMLFGDAKELDEPEELVDCEVKNEIASSSPLCRSEPEDMEIPVQTSYHSEPEDLEFHDRPSTNSEPEDFEFLDRPSPHSDPKDMEFPDRASLKAENEDIESLARSLDEKEEQMRQEQERKDFEMALQLSQLEDPNRDTSTMFDLSSVSAQNDIEIKSRKRAHEMSVSNCGEDDQIPDILSSDDENQPSTSKSLLTKVEKSSKKSNQEPSGSSWQVPNDKMRKEQEERDFELALRLSQMEDHNNFSYNANPSSAFNVSSATPKTANIQEKKSSWWDEDEEILPSTSKAEKGPKPSSLSSIFSQDPALQRLMESSDEEKEEFSFLSQANKPKKINQKAKKGKKAKTVPNNDVLAASTSKPEEKESLSSIFGQDPVLRRAMGHSDDEEERPQKKKKNAKSSPQGGGSAKKDKKYYPKPGSGGYAILVALLIEESKADYKGFMTKKELCDAAQPFSDDSMTQTRPGAQQYYNGWSSSSLLFRKHLIDMWSCPKKIKLTEDGRALATEMMQKRQMATEKMEAFDDNASWMNDVSISTPKETTSNFMLTSLPGPPLARRKIAREKASGNCFVKLSSGRYEIILIVDIMEVAGGSTGGKKSRKNMTPEELDSLGVKYETRKLSIGDFVWIARGTNGHGAELVLPFIVERKRMDDLRSSIIDGRYKEQKQRIVQSGMTHKIYLVEEIGNYKDITSRPEGVTNKALDRNALEQAMSNTLIRDGFHVKMTKNQKESMRFLARMTRMITKKYTGVDLKETTVPTQISDHVLLPFKDFYENSRPDRYLNLREIFCNMLICQRGLSAGMAWAITGKFPTLSSLKSTYEKAASENEAVKLLVGIPYDNGTKKIPASVSKTIYHLFNDGEFS